MQRGIQCVEREKFEIAWPSLSASPPPPIPLSSWPLGIWYGHFRIKVFNAMHPMRGWGKVWYCRGAFPPTYPLSSPYATLLLTPGKLLSIQTFLEGQSVIPVLRILLCLQHKHVMNNLKGKYVFMPLGSLSLLGWTFFWNKLFQKGRPKLSLEAFPPINEVADR